MPHRTYPQEKRWGRRVTQGALIAIILVICFDYGKHWVLKKILENEIAQSRGVVSVESLAVSPWPLLQNHLILKNLHVTISGAPLTVGEVHIRQGWLEWGFAHIQATDVRNAEAVFVQEAHGILTTTDLRTRVAVSPLILKGIQARLPLLSFSGSEASLDFLYNITRHHLFLKIDAPVLSFSNDVTFGIKGEGNIYVQAPIQGKMTVEIKNIDKMMKELVAVGVVNASQAGLVTQGSRFLGSMGIHDITLPLTIQDGNISLGPLPLFKMGA